MADLKTLRGIAEKDRKLIEEAESLVGVEPASMGFVKNLFWGRVREELLFPYPQVPDAERAECDALLAALDHYLQTEHPAIRIDQDQEIPPWVIDRLFELGVMGMTIPKELGGRGLGITSYNRVLERIGRSCGSTAVLVSAHQSIGCKAIMLFGTDEQKRQWLPHLAADWVSAFCLSEPNVGCDAGGQETRCTLSDDGTHYLLNGEKKWTTSGAFSQIFTVMAKQKLVDAKTGKTADKVTALICTPDMPGIDIYQNNRSKCGIRGTWQARIRFHDVRVPRSNLLHHEGKGLNVALSCLNYGRCTLSAGMLGGAKRSFEQSTKWAQTRFQFQRPLADFELVKSKIARMSALCYAMDAVLYMTTAMLDRHDEDVMVETAICKLFCSEMGWRVVNDAMQIMGGEGYMTENEIERVFRDSRINLIVEGANEVMQAFIFAYGGKSLAESMLTLRESLAWEKSQSPSANLKRIVHNLRRPGIFRAAVALAAELLLGRKTRPTQIDRIDPSLAAPADRLSRLIRDHSHNFKRATMVYGQKLLSRQLIQARLADSAIWLHAYACTLSKLDRDIRRGKIGVELENAHAAAALFFDMAESETRAAWQKLFHHHDDSIQLAARAALRHSDTLPTSRFITPESSPIAKGAG
ncbi:MAG TPA: acyl-CoA dehydrogenase family protein, partial [Tepidisphaeraceae bacterium]|nr:acyl-CoA dehydrogenase family protein [Tepidisphaeraceae bacterium]